MQQPQVEEPAARGQQQQQRVENRLQGDAMPWPLAWLAKGGGAVFSLGEAEQQRAKAKGQVRGE